MTLKERMNVIHYVKLGGINKDSKGLPVSMHDDQIEKCVEVAEEFAVNFAEWCFIHDRKYPEHNNNTKELFEIFKKEKGL